MSLADAVSALRESALFGRIDDGRLKLIALTGETLRFRAGEILFERGDDGEAAFVIVSGRAEVRIPTDDGARTIAVRAGANCSARSPRCASGRAPPRCSRPTNSWSCASTARRCGGCSPSSTTSPSN